MNLLWSGVGLQEGEFVTGITGKVVYTLVNFFPNTVRPDDSTTYWCVSGAGRQGGREEEEEEEEEEGRVMNMIERMSMMGEPPQ